MNQIVKYNLLLCLFIISNWSSAQKVKNVLVIPFERFEMHSDIKLAEINEINGIKGDKFYASIILGIREAFEINSNEKVAYTVISDDDWEKIKAKMDYGIEGSNSHYACLIDSVNMQQVRDIMKDNYCDYLLTLNCYKITQTKSTFKNGTKKKVVMYSSHYLDYDFFTPLGTLLKSGSNYEVEVNANTENYKFSGLRISDLRLEYPKMVDHITGHFLSEE